MPEKSQDGAEDVEIACDFQALPVAQFEHLVLCVLCTIECSVCFFIVSSIFDYCLEEIVDYVGFSHHLRIEGLQNDTAVSLENFVLEEYLAYSLHVLSDLRKVELLQICTRPDLLEAILPLDWINVQIKKMRGQQG